MKFYIFESLSIIYYVKSIFTLLRRKKYSTFDDNPCVLKSLFKTEEKFIITHVFVI